MQSIALHRLNASLAAFFVGLHVVALIVYPLWPSHVALGALVIAALSSNTLWALLHEGMHGRLFAGRRANRVGSRVLSVFLGAPFAALQTSHLAHHAVNRTELERPDVLTGSAWVGVPAYYSFLLGGLYLGGLWMSLSFLMPAFVARRVAARARGVAGLVLTKLANGRVYTELRVDGFLIACLYGFALWRAPIATAAFIATRALLISFLDYVYHYRTRFDDLWFAKNLNAGRWRRLLLGFNLHGVHHARPHLPWTELFPEFVRSGAQYDGSFAGAAFAQLRGPFRLEPSIAPAGERAPHPITSRTASRAEPASLLRDVRGRDEARTRGPQSDTAANGSFLDA